MGCAGYSKGSVKTTGVPDTRSSFALTVIATQHSSYPARHR